MFSKEFIKPAIDKNMERSEILKSEVTSMLAKMDKNKTVSVIEMLLDLDNFNITEIINEILNSGDITFS